MVEPVFFLSYARRDATHAKEDLVRIFFDDVVQELVGLRGESHHGFLDESIRSGDRWEPTILDAIRSTQVLVALLSPGFLESRYCNAEWDLFEKRLSRSGATGIVSIRWRTPRKPLPAKIAAIQHFDIDAEGEDDERARSLYEQKGLRSIMMLRESRRDCMAAYVLIVSQVADRVHEIATERRLPVLSDRETPSFTEGSTTAGLASPPEPARQVHVAALVPLRPHLEEQFPNERWTDDYPADSEWNWTPHRSTDRSIDMTAQVCATELSLRCRHESIDDELIASIRGAEERELPFLVLIDPWATTVGTCLLHFAQLNDYQLGNCHLIVVWGDKSPSKRQAHLTQRLRQVLSRGGLLQREARTSDELLATIKDAVKIIQQKFSQLRGPAGTVPVGAPTPPRNQ